MIFYRYILLKRLSSRSIIMVLAVIQCGYRLICIFKISSLKDWWCIKGFSYLYKYYFFVEGCAVEIYCGTTGRKAALLITSCNSSHVKWTSRTYSVWLSIDYSNILHPLPRTENQFIFYTRVAIYFIKLYSIALYFVWLKDLRILE